jgi:hypothetical protein
MDGKEKSGGVLAPPLNRLYRFSVLAVTPEGIARFPLRFKPETGQSAQI